VLGLVYALWRDSALQRVEELEREEDIFLTAAAD
jgi:hypothetical protein